MEWWLLTFFIGAILALFIPIVPDISLLFFILVAALLFLFIEKARTLSFMLLGVCWLLIAGFQEQHSLVNNHISLALMHKQTINIQGHVANIVHQTPTNNRFNFTVSHWQGKILNNPFIVRLNWKRPTKKLLQGQRWQLKVKLKPAHGFANVGGFNYRVWLMHQQIIATGYVKSLKAKPDEKPSILKSIDNQAESKKTLKVGNYLLAENITWRQQLHQKVSVMLDEQTLGPLLLALGFGERGKLTDDHWQVLSTTSTSHLIAISGLHIGIVALISFGLARWVLEVLPLNRVLSSHKKTKLMRLNFKCLPIIFSCLVAWYYAYLAGYSIPTLRALVMLCLFWFFKINAINVSLFRWLLLSIFVIIMCWPLSLLSASFWLSVSALCIIFATATRFLSGAKFPDTDNTDEIQNSLVITTQSPEKSASTLFLSYYQNAKVKLYSWCKNLFIIQLALTICMLPLAASLNHQLPLLSFFANIIAVPLMSVTAIPLTLFGVITLPINESLSQLFFNLAHFSLEIIWLWLSYITAYVEKHDWAQLSISNSQLELLYLVVIVISAWLYFRLNKVFLMYVTAFAFGVFALLTMGSNTSKNSQSLWQLSVLDVGHGLAVVIEKNDHVFLYDVGASYPSGFNMADAVVLPYLTYQGYQQVDGIIISHNDNDHAGSLLRLREKIKVNKVIANDMTFLPDDTCLQGDTFTWQGLQFEFLSPMQVKGDKNDDSCVVVISDGFHRILLPGDISIKQEQILLNNNKLNGQQINNIQNNSEHLTTKLASDILIAPHHGSKSSSSLAFLSAVAPDYAVFSTGYLNHWNMPSPQVLSRYKTEKIVTFNTAEVGMVTFVMTPSTIEALSYRKNIRPYWFNSF